MFNSNSVVKIITLVSALIMVNLASVSNASENKETPTPIGFKKLALYMGTGLFDPNLDEPRPGVVGCKGLFCAGEFFQYEIMHRTPDEVAAIESDAKSYFLEQFGIDVDDPTYANRITFMMFMVNPDFQYRLHALSGEDVSDDGWIIRDGGFMISVIDPNGIVLGGKQAGLTAPEGAAMFFGNYNILATGKHNHPKEEIIVYYKSIVPGETLENGSFVFKCDMFNEDWGQGLGLGTLNFLPQDDGRIRANGRNILTFPPVSDVIDFPSQPDFAAHPEEDHSRHHHD